MRNLVSDLVEALRGRLTRLRTDGGVTAVEYALLVALLGVVLVPAAGYLQSSMGKAFLAAAGDMSAEPAGGADDDSQSSALGDGSGGGADVSALGGGTQSSTLGAESEDVSQSSALGDGSQDESDPPGVGGGTELTALGGGSQDESASSTLGGGSESSVQEGESGDPAPSGGSDDPAPTPASDATLSVKQEVVVKIGPIVGSNSAKVTSVKVTPAGDDGAEVEFEKNNNGSFKFKSDKKGTYTVTFGFADQATKITGEDTWTVTVQ